MDRTSTHTPNEIDHKIKISFFSFSLFKKVFFSSLCSISCSSYASTLHCSKNKNDRNVYGCNVFFIYFLLIFSRCVYSALILVRLSFENVASSKIDSKKKKKKPVEYDRNQCSTPFCH